MTQDPDNARLTPQTFRVAWSKTTSDAPNDPTFWSVHVYRDILCIGTSRRKVIAFIVFGLILPHVAFAVVLGLMVSPKVALLAGFIGLFTFIGGMTLFNQINHARPWFLINRAKQTIKLPVHALEFEMAHCSLWAHTRPETDSESTGQVTSLYLRITQPTMDQPQDIRIIQSLNKRVIRKVIRQISTFVPCQLEVTQQPD
jgi:hypothetical protein